MAALPSIITSPEIRYLVAGVLILTGLALGFWGHGLWATVMSMIGALLGAVVGYLFGAALGGDLGGAVGRALDRGDPRPHHRRRHLVLLRRRYHRDHHGRDRWTPPRARPVPLAGRVNPHRRAGRSGGVRPGRVLADRRAPSEAPGPCGRGCRGESPAPAVELGLPSLEGISFNLKQG